MVQTYKHGNFLTVHSELFFDRNSQNKKYFVNRHVNENIPAEFWLARYKI